MDHLALMSAALRRKTQQAQQEGETKKEQQKSKQQEQRERERQCRRQKRERVDAGAGAPAASASDTDSDSDAEEQRQRRQQAGAAASGAGTGGSGGAPADKERGLEAGDVPDENRPRVVAYSDSDSDVESHFSRVKTLLPPSDHEEEDAAEGEGSTEAGARPAGVAGLFRGRRKGAAGAGVAAAAADNTTHARRGAAGAALGAAAREPSPALAARVGALLLLRRVAPHLGQAAQLLSVALPLASVAAAQAGAQAPAALQPALRQVGELGKAALTLSAARLVRSGLRRRRRRRREQQQDAEQAGEEQVVGPQTLRRSTSSCDVASLCDEASLVAAIKERRPESAAEWAQVVRAELKEMERLLQENQVALPAPRFGPGRSELLRFAKACGLLEARSPEARAAAIEAGVGRVARTLEWAKRQTFLDARAAARWERLVAWRSKDAAGHPILLIRVGRAQQLVKASRYEEFCTAVQRGVDGHLSAAPPGGAPEGGGGAPGAPRQEQMVVVLDCRGASSLGITRHLGLLKKLAVTLNTHYPDRLHRLYLLELPLLLRWVVAGVTPLLHPHTRAKLQLASISDPDLAITVAFLTKRRSTPVTPGLRRSSSQGSFPGGSSGASTPGLLSPQSSPQMLPPAPLPAAGALAGAAEALAAAAKGARPELPVAADCRANHPAAPPAPVGGGAATPPPTLRGVRSPPHTPATPVPGSPISGGAPRQAGAGPSANPRQGGLRLQSPRLFERLARSPFAFHRQRHHAYVERGAGPATAALADGGVSSHALPGTPGSLVSSPGLSRQGSGAAAAATDAAAAAAAAVSPPSLEVLRPALERLQQQQQRTRLRSHRVLSAAASPCFSAGGAGSPRVAARGPPSAFAPSGAGPPKGGLTELPARPVRRTLGRGARATPLRSSLRRSASADMIYDAGGTPGGSAAPAARVGSFPLRRVSSVSWAEELESIRELESAGERSDSESASGGSPRAGGGMAASAARAGVLRLSPPPPRGRGVAGPVAAALPLLAAALLLAALVQQLLLALGGGWWLQAAEGGAVQLVSGSPFV
eukprot:scaffold9.g3089.t1